MKILIWRVRKSKHISLRELSSKTGIGKTTINDLENQKNSPTLMQLESIAKALECRITDLYESNYK